MSGAFGSAWSGWAGAAALAAVACSSAAEGPVDAPLENEPVVPAPAVSAPTPAPPAPRVTTTDVSVLYPLPRPGTGDVAALVRPTEAGIHGPLLSETLAIEVLSGTAKTTEMRLDFAEPSAYRDLALVAVRLDPCGGRVASQGCVSEVRAVFQSVYTPQSQEAAPAFADGAFHVSYDVPEAELVSMLREILALREAQGGPPAVDELGPHPVLQAQGLDGAFATGFRAILLAHLGESRTARITIFDHWFFGSDETWTFSLGDVAAGQMTRGSIPISDSTSQMVLGSKARGTALEETSAEVTLFATLAIRKMDALLSKSRLSAPPDAATRQLAFDTATDLAHPGRTGFPSSDCAACHLAEGARRVGLSLGLRSAGEFSIPRGTAHRDERESVTNLHAFGYLGRQVSIMQRTANESASVADAMQEKLR